jgi:hypothetical protein
VLAFERPVLEPPLLPVSMLAAPADVDPPELTPAVPPLLPLVPEVRLGYSPSSQQKPSPAQ